MSIVCLLTFALLLYVAGNKAPGARSGLDRGVLSVSAPLQRAVIWSVESAQDLWFGYVYLVGTEKDNLKLRRAEISLRGEVLRAKEIESENRRLRHLLALPGPDQSPPLIASVIGIGVMPGLARTVRVGRGREAGVRIDQPAVTPLGAVGSVVSVGRNWADVLLLADPNAALAAQVVRSRSRVTVRGTGSMNEAVLENALRTDDLVEGDLLVTAGTGGIFPKGIPVGRVSGVERGRHGLFQKAQVIPVVDLARLDELMILMGEGPPDGLAAHGRLENAAFSGELGR